MAIRAAHVGTGNVGRLALAALLGNPAAGACSLPAAQIVRRRGAGSDAGPLQQDSGARLGAVDRG